VGQPTSALVCPVTPGRVVVGYAYLTQAGEVNAVPEVPYVGLLAALDGIARMSVDDLQHQRCGAVGGAHLDLHPGRGARGSVCDGMMRDTLLVGALGFRAIGKFHLKPSVRPPRSWAVILSDMPSSSRSSAAA
jgi:hypothetical protein